jgi:curved DNA-binding protein CbpA
MDPFSVLGVSRDASEAQVKDAFRKAALQWHPDRHVGGSAAVRALAAQKFAEARFWAPRASPFNALQSASALPFRALTLSAQISRAYEHLTDPSRRRNGGEWRQRSSTQGAWQSHGWRERSYAGAQSAAGSGPYTWRHTDMGGARTAAEEGARHDRGRPGIVFRGLRLVALFRSAVDAQTLQQGLGRRGCRVRATRFRLWCLLLGSHHVVALQGTHPRFPHGQLAAGVAHGWQSDAKVWHVGRPGWQQPCCTSRCACCAPAHAGAAVALGRARAGVAVSTTKAATAQRRAAAVVCHACTQRRRRCGSG